MQGTVTYPGDPNRIVFGLKLSFLATFYPGVLSFNVPSNNVGSSVLAGLILRLLDGACHRLRSQAATSSLFR